MTSFAILRKYSSLPKIPKCDFVPKKYKGPSLKELDATRKTYLNPALTTYYSKPLAIHQGYKQWLFDLDGKRYLDMFGGICTVSVGYSHPRITEAVKDQIETLGHCPNVYYHQKIHEYAERLADKLPKNLKVIYFVNSGSEANDLAVLMARCYTGKFDIMSLKNCYHGMTYQTMALTSNNYYKYPVPQNAGFYKTMNPDVYKGIWGGSRCRDSPVQADRDCSCKGECEAGKKYLEQFECELNHDICKTGLAAFFAESIQGVGGAVQYPKNYIKGVYDIIKNKGGLFVSDEVQTGFGRTGDHFWGFEGHDIEPDIVTMAKGIGNGFPLGAVATSTEIAKSLTAANHFNTFGGNPIATTVGITVLDVSQIEGLVKMYNVDLDSLKKLSQIGETDSVALPETAIIEDEQLQQNSKSIGTHLLLELAKLRDREHVGDVRGKGLMIGVELVADKNFRRPLEASKFMKVWELCRDMGLIIGKGGLHGNVLRIKPPMCVTQEDADFTVDVLKQALSVV